MIRILLIPSSDYLGHPFPQRHNHIFERIHDGKDFEVHIVRFNIFGKPKLTSKCIIHEFPSEFKTSKTSIYYLSNAVNHLQEIVRIIKHEGIGVVVAGNLLPPLLLGLYREISRLKIPFIFDLQDYYPTSAAGYITNVNSPLGTFVKGFFEGITQTLIKMADAVTVPGFALAIYARSIRRERDGRVYIVPNGVSEHFFKLYDGSQVRRKLGYEEDDLVVGYIGSVEFWLDMKTLIKALSKAHREGLRIKFLLIGGRLQTSYAGKVAKWIREDGIEHITNWIGFVEHDKVPEYIAALDIGTIPFDAENPTAYYAAPNKLWEYLSQGASVVATPIPEALAYRNLVYIARTEEEYVAIFGEIAKKRNIRNSDRNIVSEYLKKRTWSNSAEMFKKIIQNLVSHK